MNIISCEMKRITDFLNECGKCEWSEEPYYNGFLDEDNYDIYISRLYDNAVSALVEHGKDASLQTIKRRCTEIAEKIKYSDFPSDKGLSDMREEVRTTTNDNFRKSYNHLLMSKQCRGRQLYLFSEFQKYLQEEEGTVEETSKQPTVIVEPVDISKDQDEIIKGVRQLAKFLHCGTNRANEIAKSGILVSEGVQFKFGNANHFHKKKLVELLTSKPDLFKDLHWH